MSNCKLIIAARVCRVRHFPVGIAGCVVLLLYGLGALAAVPDSKDGELDFSGSRRSLLRAEPQLRNARSGYGLAAIHTDGKGSLTSVNATEGGFSVPNSQPGTQKIGLRLQPDAWAAGLRVRLLSQTLPGDSRYYGWEFSEARGGVYTKMSWFRGARVFRHERIGHLKLPVDVPLDLTLQSVPNANGEVELVAGMRESGGESVALSRYVVRAGNGDGVPLLGARNPGMLFYSPAGKASSTRLIDRFSFRIEKQSGAVVAGGAPAPVKRVVAAPSQERSKVDEPVRQLATGRQQQPAAAPAGGRRVEIVVDNDGPGTTSTGNWMLATGASQHYRSVSRYADSGGQVDRYRFTPVLPAPGRYTVSAWNSCYPRETRVAHQVVHGDGNDVVFVNQDCRSGTHGAWYPLGTYRFEAGQGGYVEITDEGASGGSQHYIGADAVRFVGARDASTEVAAGSAVTGSGRSVDTGGLVLDNGADGTRMLGSWKRADGVTQQWGEDSVFATVGGVADTYLFRVTVPTTGRYVVQSWNACYSPRHHGVPHTIRHADGIDTVFVDQDCQTGSAGEWFTLGTWRFTVEAEATVGISDAGLRTGSTTYIGADAVRLVPESLQ